MGFLKLHVLFVERVKKIIDIITENKQFYLKQTDNGIKLKENHIYYYQVQGLMGITGLKWCDFWVWTGVDFFQQRIMFDETLWNNMRSKLTNFYFEHSYTFLTRKGC